MGANNTKTHHESESKVSADFSTQNTSGVSTASATTRTSLSDDESSNDDVFLKRKKTSHKESFEGDHHSMKALTQSSNTLRAVSLSDDIHSKSTTNGEKVGVKSTNPANIRDNWYTEIGSGDELLTKTKNANNLPKIKSKLTVKAHRSSFESDNDLLNELTRKTDFIADDGAAYPESYAQKLRNQKYKRQDSDLLREKTIVRDPDEWAYAYENKHLPGTDKNLSISTQVSEVHAAHRASNREQREESWENVTRKDPAAKVPHYDVSEEMLMSEIEKEFL